jgi:hypothetical protein
VVSLKHQDAAVKQARFGTKAVRFLQQLYPNGPWVLTAIIPEGGSGATTTATFSDPEEAREFIAEHNIERAENLHYSINPTKERLRSKASKQDIAAAAYLHVDADPRDDESPEAAKKRIRRVLKTFAHKPTFEVDSGNGLQFLWRLQTPIELRDAEAIARTESRNHALADIFGADVATRNVDRVFRLPGTWNIPNPKKLRLGRKECKAQLVEFNEDAVYKAKCFPVRVAPEPSRQPAADADSRSEFPQSLRQYLFHTNFAGYETRSHLLMAFLGAAVRHKGLSDAAIIEAVESTFRGTIWRHCDDKGGTDYLRRQVKRARAKAEAGDDETRLLAVKRMDEIPYRKLTWLWHPFIPRSMISMIFGDGEVGKSTLLLDLIARITRGGAARWPQFDPDQPRPPARQPGSVIIVCKEDDASFIIRPRLEAAGADLTKVYFLGYPVPGDATEFDPVDRLDTVAEELEQLVEEIGDVELISIDPITDYVGRIDSYRDSEVRALLHPFARIAARHGLALVYVLHLNKKADLQAKHRGLGSVAFRNVSKSSLLVAMSKEQPDCRLLVQEKRNLTPDRRAVAFKLLPAPRSAWPRVEWMSGWQENVDIDELLTPAKPANKRQQAVEFLRSTLRSGPQPATTVIERARHAGISEATLKLARPLVGVIAQRVGRGWMWRLPSGGESENAGDRRE